MLMIHLFSIVLTFKKDHTKTLKLLFYVLELASGLKFNFDKSQEIE